VTITSPTYNSTFYVGDTVILSADASDNDGTITNVEFYLDFALVGVVTSSPYRLSVTVTNGPAYYRFQVRATDNWGVTTVSSEVQFLVTYPPPGNDDFANRIPITGSWLTVTGDNGYATRDPADPTQAAKSVWWSWTAPTSGVYTVTAVGLPGFFCPFLGVYTGSGLSNLTLLASATCGGAYPTYAARVVISATGGTPYTVAVSTVSGFGGGLNLSVTTPAPPGTPAKFDSITKLQDGAYRVTFRTGASSIWRLETSTNLTDWEGTYIRYLPDGLYEFHDLTDEVLQSRFYRLIAEP
jgi:hypothetical protein